MISSHIPTVALSAYSTCEHMEWNTIRLRMAWTAKRINIHWNEFSYTTPQWHHRIDYWHSYAVCVSRVVRMVAHVCACVNLFYMDCVYIVHVPQVRACVDINAFKVYLLLGLWCLCEWWISASYSRCIVCSKNCSVKDICEVRNLAAECMIYDHYCATMQKTVCARTIYYYFH